MIIKHEKGVPLGYRHRRVIRTRFSEPSSLLGAASLELLALHAVHKPDALTTASLQIQTELPPQARLLNHQTISSSRWGRYFVAWAEAPKVRHRPTRSGR